MKKLICFILCVLVISSFTFITVGASADEVKSTDPDYIALETVKNLTNNETNTITKQELYDIFFNQIGYVFEYCNSNDSGYGIMLKENNDYYVNEFLPHTNNPYKNDCLAIYYGMFNYIEYIKGEFYDAITGQKLSDKIYAEINTLVDNQIEKFYYTRKEQYTNIIDRKMPTYYGSSYNNSCGNIAGGSILGYYDLFYPELIPDFDAYQDGAYVNQTSKVTEVIDQLYYDMQTDINGGTTYSTFKSGLTTYLNRLGRSCSFSLISSNGKMNQTSLTSAVNNDTPVALFFDTYNSIDIFWAREGYDQVSTNYYSGAHVMVAYGYRNIYYYVTEIQNVWSPVWYNPFRTVKKPVETNTRTDNYLYVATGIGDAPDAFVRLYDNCNLDYAITVNIW